MQKTHSIEFVPTVDIGFGLRIDGVLYRIAANTPEKRVELEAAQTPEDKMRVLIGEDGLRIVTAAADEGLIDTGEMIDCLTKLFGDELNVWG